MYVADLIAPHYCISCSAEGALFCVRCIEYTISERREGCIACGRIALAGVCGECCLPYERAWCADERMGALKVLLDTYKYERARAAHLPLAEIVVGALPELPADVVVTNIPTIMPHVRQRGYDHTALIAKEIAFRKHLTYTPLLGRKSTSVQVGKTRQVRELQAKTAFEALVNNPPKTVLLVDDVFTTGATVRYAAQTLKNAGVSTVWVAVVARQPLDG